MYTDQLLLEYKASFQSHIPKLKLPPLLLPLLLLLLLLTSVQLLSVKAASHAPPPLQLPLLSPPPCPSADFECAVLNAPDAQNAGSKSSWSLDGGSCNEWARIEDNTLLLPLPT
jgi:hypothetical protein